MWAWVGAWAVSATVGRPSRFGYLSRTTSSSSSPPHLPLPLTSPSSYPPISLSLSLTHSLSLSLPPPTLSSLPLSPQHASPDIAAAAAAAAAADAAAAAAAADIASSYHSVTGTYCKCTQAAAGHLETFHSHLKLAPHTGTKAD